MKKELFIIICNFVCIFLLTACSVDMEGLDLASTNSKSQLVVQTEGELESSINTYETEDDESMQETKAESVQESEEKPAEHLDDESATETSESYVRVPYELDSLTESYYEKNGSYIEFNDLPENDAETIACLRLLYSITGKSWTECGYEYYYVPEESSECREEIEEESWESICEWIKVEQVETMSLDSLAECDPRQELFAILKRQLYAGGTYEDYVQMLLDNGCVVVCVEYTDQYKAGYETVQVGDGAHETHWLFVPDENGQLRVFDYTGIFGQFNMSPGAKVPEVLKWSVK